MSIEIKRDSADDFNKNRYQFHPEATSIRPMRGQCVIREIEMRKSVIWRPHDPEQTVHRGIVLAFGPPAVLSYKSLDMPEVPWDLEVGDEVVFVWSHNEREFTKRWVDGGPACWIPQANVLAVIEGGRVRKPLSDESNPEAQSGTSGADAPA